MNTFDFTTGQNLESARLAAQLTEEEDFASTLIKSSMDGIATCDLESRYTLWNPSMERLSGLKSHQVIGRVAFELFPFMKENGVEEIFQATFRGEETPAAISPFIVPETGAQGFYEYQNYPLFNERRKIVGLIAIMRDVTALKLRFDALAHFRKKLEERKHQLELKIAALT